MKKLLSTLALILATLPAWAGSALLSSWGNVSASAMGIVSAAGGATVGSTDLGTQYNAIGMSWQPVMGDTITHVGFHQGTTTGTPASGSYSVALFPLTTGGLPNTGSTFTNAALNSVTVTTFTPSNANDNKWVWVSLGANTYTVTQGQEYAIVVWRNAATDASNKITVNGFLTNSAFGGLPVALSASAGTWSKPATSNYPLMGMKSASNVYGRPFTGTTFTTIFNVGSTTESGMSFTLPTNFCSTYVVRGVRLLLKAPATSATNTFQVNLYSSPTSSPVQIAKSALVVNDRFERFGAYAFSEIYFTANSPALSCGTKYGIGLSSTASTDGGSYVIAEEAAADFSAWPFQQQTAFITRTASSFAGIDAGSATGNFSETTTQRPFIELILDDITAPASGGGSMGGVF